MARKKSIFIIYTGGTIGMAREAGKKTLVPFDFNQIHKQIPELARFHYNISSHSFQPPVDSSNMKPSNWIEIATLIGEKYNDYDGFVILHGSDTMAYTASALSFMLENLEKPVVLTGSQLPAGEVRTDAKENLITAIEIAASEHNSRNVIPEVCIYFDYQLFRGNRASKYNSAKFEAFQSVNFPPLAEAGVHVVFKKNLILKKPEGKFNVHLKLNTNVGLMKLFPGMNRSFTGAILNTPGLEGLVLEAFGAGNAPTDDWFIVLLKNKINEGLVVFDVTQCGGGSVELGRYETSRKLQEIGVISGFDITTEAAVVKLMFLLGKGSGQENLKKLLTTPLRGEMTVL
ncbi:MAG: asparaginase [Bacteroidia bacterium]